MRSSFAALTVALALAFSSVASADVVPPAGDCEGKSEGTSCKDFDGKAGSCGTITYTRSFTPPFPDAATETSTRSYFGCKVGATPNGGASNAAASSSTKKGCSVSNVESPENSAGSWSLLGFGIALAGLRRSFRGKASRRTSR
ncbi:MAG TPA: hypothetical protein VF407_07135 [Polyangiaceae bacterium]